MRHGLLLALCGVVVGLGIAAATTRYLASSLYGVTPLDRAAFAAAAALIVIASAVATFIPARRAARVDPLVAIRHD